MVPHDRKQPFIHINYKQKIHITVKALSEQYVVFPSMLFVMLTVKCNYGQLCLCCDSQSCYCKADNFLQYAMTELILDTRINDAQVGSRKKEGISQERH